jgi:hypothetical protein
LHRILVGPRNELRDDSVVPLSCFLLIAMLASCGRPAAHRDDAAAHPTAPHDAISAVNPDASGEAVSVGVDAAATWAPPEYPEVPITSRIASQLAKCSPALARNDLRGVVRVRDDIYSVQTTKLRYYVFPAEQPCIVTAVDGHPAGWVKGAFVPGAGPLIAYALKDCTSVPHEPNVDICRAAISIKTLDDRLVDVILLPDQCTYPQALERARLTASHESLRVPCLGMSGPDSARTDHLLDAGSGRLAVALTAELGARLWNPDLHRASREPGSITLIPRGDHAILRVVVPIYGDELVKYKETHPEYSGCLPVLKSSEWSYDDAKHQLVRVTPPRLSAGC